MEAEPPGNEPPQPVLLARSDANRARARSRARRALGYTIICIGAAVTAATGTASIPRTVFALLMLMIVPGGAVTMLLDLDDPLVEWSLTVSGSIALGVTVSLALLYARVWSLGLALGILVALSIVAMAVAIARGGGAGHNPASSTVRRSGG